MARPFDLTAFAYAHRGLWTEGGLPENSLAAFRAAASAGLGIEFDLRPTADGDVMVFHDPVLGRMTGADGHFDGQTAEALGTLRLAGTDEPVPAFETLLGHWPADLPMLAEMKIDRDTDPAAFAARVGARLAQWPGLAAAMSFSEAAVRALPDGLMRGQLVYPVEYAGADHFCAIAQRAMGDGVDYLAVHHADMPLAAELGAGRDIPVVVWTVRSEAELTAMRPYRPALIFEHFAPALAVGAYTP